MFKVNNRDLDQIVTNLLTLSKSLAVLLGWVTYRFSYAKRHNDTGRSEVVGVGRRGVGRLGYQNNDVLNSEKVSNFRAQELSWNVNELCTRILRVTSFRPPIAHTHTWTLWKNHPSAVFSSKIQNATHVTKKTHTHKWRENGNYKYQVTISNIQV